MEALHGHGPCGLGPGERCARAEDRFAAGGDRLARYLIRQFEETLREGYPNRVTYLSYIAYTRSDVGFEYVAHRVRNRSALTEEDAENAIHALGRTADPRAIDGILRVLREEQEHSRERPAAIRALVWIMERTGSRREDAVRALRELRSDRRVSHYVAKKLDELGVE